MELIVWALAVMAVSDAARGIFTRLPPWSGWLIAITTALVITLVSGTTVIDALAVAGLSAILRGIASLLINTADWLSAKSFGERMSSRR